MKSRDYIYLALLAIAIVLAFFYIQNYLSQKADAQCSKDTDCIAAECCHATQCGPVESAPDCSTLMCTQECVPNTLDCGQASCVCNKGACAVRSNE